MNPGASITLLPYLWGLEEAACFELFFKLDPRKLVKDSFHAQSAKFNETDLSQVGEKWLVTST